MTKKIIIPVALALSSSASFAQLATNVGSMFVAFQPSIGPLIKLTIAVSMIIGLVLVINSIYKLAQLGESGGRGNESIKGPLVMFFCGLALFGLMLSLRTVGQTVGLAAGPGDFLMPGSSGGSGMGQVIVIALLWFMRLVGFIALVRGFLLLNKSGQSQGQGNGELGRGLTHIVGGAFCIHIDVTARILANTFAPNLSMPF